MVAQGIDLLHRCTWVTVLIQYRLTSFCSIHALNTRSNSLWDWMASSLPTIEWLLGGDFNMVEWSKDKNGGSNSIIYGMEK